jgi:Tfp pilus assembly protein PilN
MNLNFGHSPLGGGHGGRAGGDAGLGASFLPEDYLQRRKERRTNFIALTLFCIVMFFVVAAFFVTNRKWTEVKARQAEINARYTEEGRKIEQLKVLEAQKQEMLEKAEITAALIERVPRSILLAEIINRMPEQLTLTDFRLSGKRIKEAPPPAPKEARPKARSLVTPSGPGAKDEPPPPPKPVPPKFDFTVELIGLAAADDKVADYHAALKDCPLLENVDLVYTGTTKIDEVERRKFRFEAKIRPTADARHIEPLHIERRRLGGRIVTGPDGKPVLQSEPWLDKHGLVPSRDKPAGATADAGAAPAEPAGEPGQAPAPSPPAPSPAPPSPPATAAVPGQEVKP